MQALGSEYLRSYFVLGRLLGHFSIVLNTFSYKAKQLRNVLGQKNKVQNWFFNDKKD